MPQSVAIERHHRRLGSRKKRGHQSQHCDGYEQSRNVQLVFHSQPGPNRISSTNLLPRYARTSSVNPTNVVRVANVLRQPNAYRPARSTAKITHDAVARIVCVTTDCANMSVRNRNPLPIDNVSAMRPTHSS